MSRGLNKAMLIGNVGADPEIRTTSGGTLVANVSLATNRSWKDRNTGEIKEDVQWHRLTFWGRLAEIVEQYVSKGDRIYAEGRIEYSETERDGVKRYWTDVVVDELVMLGGDGSAPRGGGGGQRRSSGGGRKQSQGQSAPPFSEPDDDLPF